MSDADTTLGMLKDAVWRFAEERAWHPFHSPKNLAMGLAVEAAELMEHFLWVDCDESRHLLDDADKRMAIADELADIACYLLTFGYTANIDLSEAVRAKLAKNALKYPAEEFRGKFET